MLGPLSHYPYVIVRIGCETCARKGAYRLARLAAKYGPEIDLADVLAKLTFDCYLRSGAHPGLGACKARFVDFDRPRPPDDKFQPFQVINGGKKRA